MGSLFDPAAGLSQYAEPSDEDVYAESRQRSSRLGYSIQSKLKPNASSSVSGSDSPHTSNNQETGDHCSQVSALSLLDEALLTIYEARQPQQNSNKLTAGLVHQRSAPDLYIKAFQPDDDYSDDLHLKISRKSSRSPSLTTSMTLQNVFSQSLATKTAPTPMAGSSRNRIPPPPPAPPTLPSSLSVRSVRNQKPSQDPDVEARTALRELQEEIDQLPHEATANAAQIQRHQRVLIDKYLGNRLNQLPSTPFVLLAKRKIQQKVDQLGERHDTTRSKAELDKPAAATILPTAQHDMLVKLALIPESHVAKLSSTQQKMVQFAKRYDKILKLSSEELQRLPVSQAQLLQQLKDQLPKAT